MPVNSGQIELANPGLYKPAKGGPEDIVLYRNSMLAIVFLSIVTNFV